jgi:hypothetical protein
MNAEKEKIGKFKSWLKKVGIAGFIFFTLKGLMWLFVLLWLGKCTVE